MASAVPSEALRPFTERELPEMLWRGSCIAAGAGNSDQAEWLHEMAVTLLDINELPVAAPRAVDGLIDSGRNALAGGASQWDTADDSFDLF